MDLSFSRTLEDLSMADLSVGSDNLTCPACRISIIPTRLRSMCPFCGSFYDPQAEEDVNIRSRLDSPRLLPLTTTGGSDHHHLHPVTFRLPRIVSP